MNFLLVFFLILTNCTRYEITYTNYDSIKELIPNSNEIDLYDEITNNSDFSCLFEVNEDMKEIKIIKLYNVDRETGDNIFPTIFCKINDNKCLILIGLKLSRLPNQFVKLKELEFLDLSDNDFKEFPQSLFSLSKLRILYFNSNEFDTISPEIIKMSHLEILSIWDCFNLINISPNLFKLENLKELDLSRNPVLFKNNDFITCPDYLDNKASTKNVSNDYTKFVSFKSLKKLYISDNGLNTFPDIFCNFINLEKLVISMNSFEEIPLELYSFANLKILNIFSNRIEKVIIEDGMFNNLLELYLGYNKISEISISDNALRSLETFDLSCNNFQNLNKNILKTIKKLKKCIIIDNIFTEIERYIYEGDDLINLTLILKDIGVLPNIFEFNCIHELIVECKGQSNNEIDIFEYVPINSQIKHLNLSHCFLISISSGISKLINLETFNAINNKIIILDNVFTDMNSLKLLDLSFNQIANIDRSIFDIVTLEELKLAFNHIELLPSNINNTSNRNLQIDLCRNPLYLGIDVNLFYPELITIEQISDDLLRNIRYDRIRTSQETDTEIRREYINMDLNVKIYYEELNIPTDERLNLEEIKSCQVVKPGNHRKTKEEIKKISQDIFTQIDTCDKEAKIAFLIRRMDDYYSQDRNTITMETPTKEYVKRNSIIDYLESIVNEIDIMLTEDKKEDVGYILDNILFGLNFELNDNNDTRVRCLDGQSETCINTYLSIKPKNGSTDAKEKIREIITKLKDDILKDITTNGSEEEEVEIFIKWKDILSDEIGFQKGTNLFADLDMSNRTELYDKKYIIEQFFIKFTFQTIKNEINRYMKIEKLGNELYNQLSDYVTYIHEGNEEFSKIFEITDDGNFFQLQDEGAHILLKSMGYIYIEEKNNNE